MRKFLIIMIVFLGLVCNTFALNSNERAKKAGDHYPNISKYTKDYASTSDVIIENDFARYISDRREYTGTVIDRYPNGNVRFIKVFNKGQYEGPMYFFYENTDLMKVLYFSNGRKNGEEIEFYTNGVSKYYRKYNNGQLNGDVYLFNDRGNLTSAETYKNGLKEGIAYNYDANKVSEKLNYKNGRLEGQVEGFFSDGVVKYKGVYKNNLRDGKWEWFFQDSKKVKLSEDYLQGRLNGETKGYFKNGQLERQLVLKNGNGEIIQYYDNGALKIKGSYKNYKKSGKWTFYNKNGNVMKEEYY